MKTKSTDPAAATPADDEGLAQGEYVATRRGNPPCMKASAADLTYRPAAAAAKIVLRWGRVVVEYGVDRETGLPRSIRITPATAGKFGYKVRQSSGSIRRVWLYVPVPAREWQVVDPGGFRPVVEEIVSESEILVSIPFEFKLLARR